jgi:hypothetical protein
MANVNVNRLTNANIYVDGQNLLGMCEEVKVARVKAKMAEHKGLGMAGTGEFPAGLDKLEATLKWVSFYDVSEILTGSPYEAHEYQIRGNIETYGPMGIVAETPGAWYMTGVVSDMGHPVFKQHDNVEVTTTITVYHTEEWIGDLQIFLYDLLSNVFIVNGVDQLANFRANLGA